MSDAVKRYWVDDPELHTLLLSDDGGVMHAVVLATAYDALEAENVRLQSRLALAMSLADELLEDLELHGLHHDPSWHYQDQKAMFRALAASNDKGDGT